MSASSDFMDGITPTTKKRKRVTKRVRKDRVGGKKSKNYVRSEDSADSESEDFSSNNPTKRSKIRVRTFSSSSSDQSWKPERSDEASKRQGSNSKDQGSSSKGESGPSTSIPSKGESGPSTSIPTLVLCPPQTDRKQTKEKSGVWRHFNPERSHGKIVNATCIHCPQVYKISGGSTSNCQSHLLKKHGIDVNKLPPKVMEEDKKLKQQTLAFAKVQRATSAEAMYTELMCADLVTANTCAKSRIIRESVEAKGFKSTQRPNTVMDWVNRTINKEQEIIKKKLIDRFARGERVSVTFDEYSSKKNRRHLNVNVHYSEGSPDSLGLVRVWGGQTAETLSRIVERRLAKFGLELERCVGVTTDGPTVMLKLGRIVSATHQVCLAHTVHLTVADVFYEKKKKTVDGAGTGDEEEGLRAEASDRSDDDNLDSDSDTSEVESDVTDVASAQAAAESDPDSDYGESEEEDRVTRDKSILPSSAYSIASRRGRVSTRLRKEIRKLKSEYKPTIDKVRYIAKKSRRSPNLNDPLQRRIIKEKGEEHQLKLDMPTRWNTFNSLCNTYKDVHHIVTPFLDEFGWKEKDLVSEEEYKSICEITDALDLIEVLSTTLCGNNLNLLSADAAVCKTVDQLVAFAEKEGNKVAEALAENLVARYVGNRNTSVLQLMAFLNGGYMYKAAAHPIKEASLESMAQTATDIYGRLYPRPREPPMQVTAATPTQATEPSNIQKGRTKVFAAEMTAMICGKAKPCTSSSSPTPDVTEEVSLYDEMYSALKSVRDLKGEMGTMTTKLYSALWSIQPTSVEAERSFSAAGLFLTKLRMRLKDQSLDRLVFMRARLARLQSDP